MLKKYYLLLFIVLPLVLSLIEALILSRRERYDWKAMGVSVFDMFARLMVDIALPLAFTAPLFNFAWEHRLMTMPLGTWESVLILFIGQEFCYYWQHRASHRIRWFWASHSVHHSPNDMNLSVAHRFSLFGKLAGALLFYVPLVWIGFPWPVVQTILAVNLLYQFWIHAAWIPKLGWLEYVLITPSAHRVHHAANLEYLDANYGGTLVVFDRLFGTYVPERADLPCRYGWVKPLKSYNWLRVEFTQWATLLRDLWRARSVKDFLGYLFLPPGWRPDGNSETTDELRRRAGVAIAESDHLA